MPPQTIDIASDIVANNVEVRNIAVAVTDNSHSVLPGGKLVRAQPPKEVPAGPPDSAVTILNAAKLEGTTLRNIGYTVTDNSLTQIREVAERPTEEAVGVPSKLLVSNALQALVCKLSEQEVQAILMKHSVHAKAGGPPPSVPSPPPAYEQHNVDHEEGGNQLCDTVGTELPQQGNSDAQQLIGILKALCEKYPNLQLGSSGAAALPSDSKPDAQHLKKLEQVLSSADGSGGARA
ncbi:hypothetical protein PLEOSDRAFT_1094731 [Pleurotus ostreatus PC15]|uniref:Uncharacterized protein n=1 Tax=Pleurotus ostreatus (strain PC15) TaxID=1137138 RepID=A0A067N809_PLEO1|nr:hypothetical protein PLEOSDRAFT_1094731 [Pleurotus ostreatus PC15]